MLKTEKKTVYGSSKVSARQPVSGDLNAVGIRDKRRRGLVCCRTLWNKPSCISEHGRAEMITDGLKPGKFPKGLG